MPDPCKTFVPWVIQTTPTKQIKNPDTILDHIADSDLLVTAPRPKDLERRSRVS
jgi:hypothetical protein